MEKYFEPKSTDQETKFKAKFQKLWDYCGVDELGPDAGIEDLNNFLRTGHPTSLKRALEGWEPEEIQNFLEMLWIKQRANETHFAKKTRPWIYLRNASTSLLCRKEQKKIYPP